MTSYIRNENDEKKKQLLQFNVLFERGSALPSDVIDYPNQVGGIGRMFRNKLRILYSEKESRVYKLIRFLPKGPHELDFLERVFINKPSDPLLMELRPFIPQFYGVYKDISRNCVFLGMKDILENFKCASACDLKVGRQSYSASSSEAKVMVEKAKYKWRENIGFLITGLRVFHPESNDYMFFDVIYGRSLNPSTIYDRGIRLFLGTDLNRSRLLAKEFVKKLSSLAKWFENQTQYNFYASSLILAYDNSEKQLINCINQNVIVYLVDFARWELVNHKKDENFLFGLNNLIELFKRATNDYSSLDVDLNSSDSE